MPAYSPLLAILDRRLLLHAAFWTVVSGLAFGLVTAIIPNPVFGRQIPPEAFAIGVWLVSAPLMGIVMATYTAPVTTMPPVRIVPLGPAVSGRGPGAVNHARKPCRVRRIPRHRLSRLQQDRARAPGHLGGDVGLRAHPAADRRRVARPADRDRRVASPAAGYRGRLPGLTAPRPGRSDPAPSPDNRRDLPTRRHRGSLARRTHRAGLHRPAPSRGAQLGAGGGAGRHLIAQPGEGRGRRSPLRRPPVRRPRAHAGRGAAGRGLGLRHARRARRPGARAHRARGPPVRGEAARRRRRRRRSASAPPSTPPASSRASPTTGARWTRSASWRT